MYSIMFVCHGNICRSPMAEFIMKDLVKKQGREAEFFISSSAVTEEEIYGGVGNPVYPAVRTLLNKRGIPCEGKRAVLLKPSDAEKYDLFACMDESNLRSATRLLARTIGKEDAEKKCKKLLSFTGEDRDVFDPWYTRDFEAAYADILRGCTALLDTLSDISADTFSNEP